MPFLYHMAVSLFTGLGERKVHESLLSSGSGDGQATAKSVEDVEGTHISVAHPRSRFVKGSISPYSSWCSRAHRCLQLPGNLSRALFQSMGINSHLFTVDLTVFGITWETHLWHVCEGICREV